MLPFMERMELDNSITISNEYQFAKSATRFALVFLAASARKWTW